METRLIKKNAMYLLNMKETFGKLKEAPGLRFRIIVSRNERILKNELQEFDLYSKVTDRFKKIKKELALMKGKYPLAVGPKVFEPGDKRYDDYIKQRDELTEKMREFWDIPENMEAKREQEDILNEFKDIANKEVLEVELSAIPQELIPEKYFDKPENAKIANLFITFCEELII